MSGFNAILKDLLIQEPMPPARPGVAELRRELQEIDERLRATRVFLWAGMIAATLIFFAGAVGLITSGPSTPARIVAVLSILCFTGILSAGQVKSWVFQTQGQLRLLREVKLARLEAALNDEGE